MFADHVYVPPVELHTYIEPPKEKIIGDILPLAVTGPARPEQPASQYRKKSPF